MNNRLVRIGEEIKKELSALLREMKDPRIAAMTSIVAVEVTRDLSYATVHVSVLGTEQEAADTLKGLKSAEGFLRREIGARVDLRHTPELRFKRDTSIAYGAHINKIISGLNIKHDEDDNKNEETNDDV